MKQKFILEESWEHHSFLSNISIKRSWWINHPKHEQHGDNDGEDDRDGNGESNDGNGESNDREDRCKIKAGNSQLVQKHVQRLHPPEHQSDRE